MEGAPGLRQLLQEDDGDEEVEGGGDTSQQEGEDEPSEGGTTSGNAGQDVLVNSQVSAFECAFARSPALPDIRVCRSAGASYDLNMLGVYTC